VQKLSKDNVFQSQISEMIPTPKFFSKTVQ